MTRKKGRVCKISNNYSKNQEPPKLVTSFGGSIDSSKRISSIFHKEDKELVETRRYLGEVPLNLSKRKEKLIHSHSERKDLEDTFLLHPSRPEWSSSDDKLTHEKKEQEYFDKWCQQIIKVYGDDILPFENNIDVWRQLWRTIEQSDVIILVVDIRNPLLHMPASLIDEVINKHNKKLLVVLTKVDLVPREYLQNWILYLKLTFPKIMDFIPFTKQPIDSDMTESGGVASRRRRLKIKPKKDNPQVKMMIDNILRICTQGYELSKKPEDEIHGIKRVPGVTIGCIGHPNVGKSSVLNSLIGTKVLSVSRTAGHTKHIQHIFLEEPYGVCVMDCPGLVFPMKQPRHIMELCGLYPIAQIRETMSAIRFLAENLELERLYNLKIPDWYDEQKWSPMAICEALAEKKGYSLSRSCGAPDIHRAGLEIIRDCIDGIVCLTFNP